MYVCACVSVCVCVCVCARERDGKWSIPENGELDSNDFPRLVVGVAQLVHVSDC